MNRTRERRLCAAEGAAGIRHKKYGLDARHAKALDDWLKAVTGKIVDEMSAGELERLERLFRASADSGAEMGDDAADLVRGCLDENQVVVDLEQRRQQLDRMAVSVRDR